MITVDVKDYCQDCMDFCPDVEKPTKYFSEGDEYVMGNTIVRCQYRKRCEAIKRYLERREKKNEAINTVLDPYAIRIEKI